MPDHSDHVKHMTLPRGHHARARRGAFEPEPVCSEPQGTHMAPEHFEGRSAAAKGYSRATAYVGNDPYAEIVRRLMPDDPGVPSDPELVRLTAQRDANFTLLVVLTLCGAMVLALVGMGAWHVLRTKPIAVDAMPINIAKCWSPTGRAKYDAGTKSCYELLHD